MNTMAIVFHFDSSVLLALKQSPLRMLSMSARLFARVPARPLTRSHCKLIHSAFIE